MKKLKKEVNETIHLVENELEHKRFDVLNFPNFSLSTVDIVLSKKYLLTETEWEKIFCFKNNIYDLNHHQFYYETIHFSHTGLITQKFNQAKLQLLNNIIEIIDDFEKNFNNYTKPKTASIIKYFWPSKYNP